MRNGGTMEHDPSPVSDEREILFFDGECGFCHAFVRFLLKRDDDGSRFAFAPIQGATYEELTTEAERERLPDSVVLFTTGRRRLLTRSAATLAVLERIGGGWSFLGRIASATIPRPLLDALYDFVACTRRRLTRKLKETCPIVPKEYRARFLP